MKILLINYEYPPVGGGAGRQCQLLAQKLSKNNQVFVLTSHYNGLPTNERINRNLSIIRMPVSRNLLFRVNAFELGLFIVKGIVHSYKLIKSNNINVIISFFAVPSGLISYIIKKILKIPYIVSLRGFDVPGHISKEYNYYQKLSYPFIKIAMEHADRVVTPSNYLKNIAQKITPNIEIEVIPNGVITAKNIKEKNNRRTIKILAIGRLNLQKRFIDLIEAVDNVKTNKEFEVAIVGNGPEKSNLEKSVISLNLRKKIKFFGWLDRKKINKLYSESNIFVMPSLEEGMSNVLLEAIAFGLPVIAVNIPSNSEIVRNNVNGYLVQKEDSKSIGEKINILINNEPLRKKFGEASRKISQKFSVNNMAEKYELLIDQISDKKPIFDFGDNWINFTRRYLNKERIREAKKSLIKLFGKSGIKGKSFVDVGCGSGLFSLAAYRLKASKIFSFDIDPKSVKCSKYLHKKEGQPKNWEIACGSINNAKFINKIGTFDIVYSYGVLHHTGNLYNSLKNASKLVSPGGLLYMGIYNKTDIFGIYPLRSFGSSKFWESEKKFYNKLPKAFKNLLDFLALMIVRLFSKAAGYKKERGMSLKNDIKDWLGGYPYEAAKADEIFLFVKKLGFSLENLKTDGGLRNNEFLFRKNLI